MSFFLHAQTLGVLVKDKPNSFRGLSVVNDEVLWVSGSKGLVGKSVDGGKTFSWMTVKGFENTDFRDIEAFDEQTALIMGISEPAFILKTVDGGSNWNIVYENYDKGMFLDAMDFYDLKNGVVVGDPMEGIFFTAQTSDGGNTWQKGYRTYTALDGEACFSSSGTNIRLFNTKESILITGGLHSRILMKNKSVILPIVQGKETTGANSVALNKSHKKIIVVGGDFMAKDSITGNCVLSYDGGKTFELPKIAPHGYRSSVEYLWKKTWISCGLNGVDFSTDDGNSWEWISKESFHVVRKAKKGKSVYFAGNGKIGKLVD